MRKALQISGLAAVVALIPVAAAASFDELSARAEAAKSANRVSEAIELYKEALQINSGWREGWWSLGTLEYEADQYAAGRDAFEHLLKLDANAAPAWTLLGLCEFETGEYAKSLADLDRGVALGGIKDAQTGAVVMYHEALALTLTQQFDKALEKYTMFARGGKPNETMLLSMGAAALRTPVLPSQIPASEHDLYLAAGKTASLVLAGNFADADQSFQALLSEYPDAPHVHFLYGEYMLARDQNLAIREFKRELGIDPGNPDALTMLAFAMVSRGDAEGALPDAERAAELAPDSAMAQYVAGRALVESGQWQRGADQLLKAERMDPANTDIHVSLAEAYAQMGKPVEARREREISKKMTLEALRVGSK
jgi:predicted Zn-dependent protease